MMADDLSPVESGRGKYAVPALEKGLDLLEHLSEQAVPMTQAELARALSRQPGEIFRMLACLEARGYLRRDPGSGGYSLSLKLFELSRTHSPYETLLQVARPLMRQLSETIGESCHLSVLQHDRVLVLAQEESPRPIRLSVEVGSLHLPTRTTSGRVLLAYAPERKRDQLLLAQPDWRGWSAELRTGFLDRLAGIRAQGCERTEGERFVGGLDLGILVGSPASPLQAALTVAALKSVDGPDLDAMLPAVGACAQAITLEAGLAHRTSAA